VSRLRIGLTGGIGSGKTTVSDGFAALGAEVIDTDALSRELVEPGQPALEEIRDTFGDAVLDPSGRLDRDALRRRVFAEPAERRRLEAILHPRIRDVMLRRAEASRAPYVVFVVPLLVETGQHELVDRVLVVDAPEHLQRERAASRDGADPEAIDRILAAQVDRATRLAHADDVITNDGPLSRLQGEIARLHESYLALAAEKTADAPR
jgi:dephospho-CoA kinase